MVTSHQQATTFHDPKGRLDTKMGATRCMSPETGPYICYIYTCLFVYICVYLCVFTRAYIYSYIYIYDSNVESCMCVCVFLDTDTCTHAFILTEDKNNSF